MAELNFGLLTPPGSQSIGNAFVSGMDQGQAAQARDLQMQQSMRQGQMAELQFRKAQDAEAKLSQWYAKIAENGGPSDPLEIEKQMIGSGIQKVVDTGLSARMARLRLEADRKGFAAANAPPAAQPAVAMPAPEPGSFGADVATRRAADMFAPPPERTNMMPGAAAAPASVNSLTALNNQIAANMALGTEQGYKNAERLQKQADVLSKRYTVGNTLMGSEGNIYGTAPENTPDLVRQYNFAKTPDGGGFRGTYQDFVLSRAGAGASRTTTNVKLPPIEGEYGKTFAKDIGEADAKLRGAAVDAPALAANANQTLKLLEDPRIFTGGAADIRLTLARALNVVGETDTASIVNTEQLIRSTGKATLASIKNSGLGTGQGFTDKDLKMLQGVEGGTIGLNADTLRAFATAQHNAAAAIVKQWETRRKGIPASALSQTGIDKETYTIEPKFSVYVETKTTPDGRRLGKKADGTVEVIK